VKALAEGSTVLVVTCRLKSIYRDIVVTRPVTAVRVSTAAPVVNGLHTSLTAVAEFFDGGTQDVTGAATWSVADPSIAELGGYSYGPGEVTGRHPGTTTVTATFRGVAGSTTLTVTPAEIAAVTISPITSLGVSDVVDFAAAAVWTDASVTPATNDVTWTSSDPTVLSISDTLGSKGRATGQAVGRATITATLGSFQASIEVDVTA
jgi:hypothetical protein